MQGTVAAACIQDMINKIAYGKVSFQMTRRQI
jgi:hypothetical protein